MTTTVALRFAGQSIFLRIDDAAGPTASLVLEFVKPHFIVEPVERPTPAALLVELLPLDSWTRPTQPSSPTIVRKGRTAETHVWGVRWFQQGRTIIEISSSRTVFDVADDGAGARVYVSDTSRYHLSDFLRELMWEIGEAAGGHFIHAAAVSNGRSAVALVGDKGAGKTTTALDLLAGGATFYSGDILFAYDHTSSVFSYPDYPGVCWGTIRANPELLSAVRDLGLPESPSDGDKVLLPHDIYLTALGVAKDSPPLPLSAVVISHVSAPGPPRIERAEPRWDLLASLERRGSDQGEGWEEFLARAGRRHAAPSSEPSAGLIASDVTWFTRLGRGRLPLAEIQQLLAEPAAQRRRSRGSWDD